MHETLLLLARFIRICFRSLAILAALCSPAPSAVASEYPKVLIQLPDMTPLCNRFANWLHASTVPESKFFAPASASLPDSPITRPVWQSVYPFTDIDVLRAWAIASEFSLTDPSWTRGEAYYEDEWQSEKKLRLKEIEDREIMVDVTQVSLPLDTENGKSENLTTVFRFNFGDTYYYVLKNLGAAKNVALPPGIDGSYGDDILLIQGSAFFVPRSSNWRLHSTKLLHNYPVYSLIYDSRQPNSVDEAEACIIQTFSKVRPPR